MTVAFLESPRKFYLVQTGEKQDKRRQVMVTQSGTKANSDATVTWETGLSEVYYRNCQGNVTLKPFTATTKSGGQVAFTDDGSTSSTAFDLFAIGRE